MASRISYLGGEFENTPFESPNVFCLLTNSPC